MDDEVEYIGSTSRQSVAAAAAPNWFHLASRPVTGLALNIERTNEDDAFRLVFRWSNAATIHIGRLPGSQVENRSHSCESGNALFRCPVVSRQHAKLVFSDSGQVYIIDMKSHHGTHIRKSTAMISSPLRPGTPVRLEEGDVITFGKTVGRHTDDLVLPIVARVELLYGLAPSNTAQPSKSFKPLVMPPSPTINSEKSHTSPKSSSGRYGLNISTVSSASESSSSSSSSDDQLSNSDGLYSDIEEISPPPKEEPQQQQQQQQQSTSGSLSASKATRTFEILKGLLPPRHEPSILNVAPSSSSKHAEIVIESAEPEERHESPECFSPPYSPRSPSNSLQSIPYNQEAEKPQFFNFSDEFDRQYSLFDQIDKEEKEEEEEGNEKKEAEEKSRSNSPMELESSSGSPIVPFKSFPADVPAAPTDAAIAPAPAPEPADVPPPTAAPAAEQPNILRAWSTAFQPSHLLEEQRVIFSSSTDDDVSSNVQAAGENDAAQIWLNFLAPASTRNIWDVDVDADGEPTEASSDAVADVTQAQQQEEIVQATFESEPLASEPLSAEPSSSESPVDTEEWRQLKSSVAQLQNEIVKLQTQRRKLKIQCNTHSAATDDKLDDFDARIYNIKDRYDDLSREVERVTNVDIVDLQKHVKSLQEQAEQAIPVLLAAEKAAAADREKPSSPPPTVSKEHEEIKDSIRILHDLVEEMRVLREETHIQMVSDLNKMRAAALACIHIQTQARAQQPQATPPVLTSLKRKRDDMDEDGLAEAEANESESSESRRGVREEDREVDAAAQDGDVVMKETTTVTTTPPYVEAVVSSAHALADLPSPRKRVRGLATAVVHTAAAIAVGAVATWSALAFS